MTTLNPEQTSIEVAGDQLELSGNLIQNPEPGTWNIYLAPNAKVYLHNSVGMESATKLFIWEDLVAVNLTRAKITTNQYGKVVGVVVVGDI